MPLPQGFQLEGQGNLPPGFTLEQADAKSRASIAQAPYNTGAAVSDYASKYLPAPVAAGLGTVANVGMHALPALMGLGAGQAVAGAGKTMARWLMDNALKPGVGVSNAAREKAVQTLLDEGINVSKGGVEKAHSIVDSLNEKIRNQISSSNATVNKGDVLSELQGTVGKFEKQVNPRADVAAVEDVGTQFSQHPLLSGNEMPVQLAQELKQGTYRVLKGKYGEQGSAATEAQKDLARGLKEGVAKAVPEIEGLNAQESALLQTLPMLERRVLVEANRNPAGLSLLAHSPGAAAAFMADKSSAFKSILARIMNSSSGQAPGIGAVSGAALAQQLGQPPKE